MFTKDSTETSGGWSVEKPEGIGAEQVDYLVKFADEKETFHSSQVVAVNGKIVADKLAAMLGNKAVYVTGYTVGGVSMQGLVDYTVNAHTVVIVEIT